MATYFDILFNHLVPLLLVGFAPTKFKTGGHPDSKKSKTKVPRITLSVKVSAGAWDGQVNESEKMLKYRIVMAWSKDRRITRDYKGPWGGSVESCLFSHQRRPY